MPLPMASCRVLEIGSATVPFMTCGTDGIARMMPRVAKITRHPAAASDRMIAFGRTRRDSLTSSAIEPADSKPRNEKPTKATVVRNGVVSQCSPCPVPALWNSTENGWWWWKNSSVTPIPIEEISSAVMEM